jgi:hypothetical protein
MIGDLWKHSKVPTINKSMLASLRAFPEYHLTVSAFESLHKAEGNLISAYADLFRTGPFIEYASHQTSSFGDALCELIRVGAKYESILQVLHSTVGGFTDSIHPLLVEEEELGKWRELLKGAEAAAVKAEQKAAVARENFKKARSSRLTRAATIDRLSVEYVSVRRAAENARLSANDQRVKVDELERPYRKRFVKSFRTPLIQMIEARAKAAAEMATVAEEMRVAAEAIAGYNDPKLEPLRAKLIDCQELEDAEYSDRPVSVGRL